MTEQVGEYIGDLCLRLRIAYGDYPASEALYSSIKEYEDVWGKPLFGSFCDNCGYVNGSCPGCIERFSK